jgi:indole-3-glycerol phosphate synthase
LVRAILVSGEAVGGKNPNNHRIQDTRKLPETQADRDSREALPHLGTDILSQIVADKWEEVALLSRQEPELRARAGDAPEPRDFKGALSAPGAVSLIAELKRRSPGAGPILVDLDPGALAAAYEEAGASALSVLTDTRYFGGSGDDLSVARAVVAIPVLRKDFVLSEVQVLEARALGADAVLLIVRILSDALLQGLRESAEAFGMAALVEVHDEAEMKRALHTGATLIGINNRNLRDFTTRLETTLRLMDVAPKSVALVSESGIRSRPDVQMLGDAGIDAILVGEALLRAASPGERARELSGVPRGPRRDPAGRG